MKYLVFFTLALLSKSLLCQTYYNPNDDVNLNLTIAYEEPFEPINWAEIGQNFNNQLLIEAQRREALKRHYAEIAFKTSASIQENIHLTSDNDINKLILELKSVALEQVTMLTSMLKAGLYGHNTTRYEEDLKNVFYQFINANQNLLFVVKYQFNSRQALISEQELNQFNSNFKQALEAIDEISPASNNEFIFKLDKTLYRGSDYIKSSNILEFIMDCCSGNIDQYKIAYTELKEQEEQRKAEESKRRQEFKAEVSKSRQDFIETLSSKEKEKFLKSESKFLFKSGSFHWIYSAKKKRVKELIEDGQYYNFQNPAWHNISERSIEHQLRSVYQHLLMYQSGQ